MKKAPAHTYISSFTKEIKYIPSLQAEDKSVLSKVLRLPKTNPTTLYPRAGPGRPPCRALPCACQRSPPSPGLGAGRQAQTHGLSAVNSGAIQPRWALNVRLLGTTLASAQMRVKGAWLGSRPRGQCPEWGLWCPYFPDESVSQGAEN